MGALHPVDRRVHLLGIENSGNTCFIDSLLFALFARMEAVDAWVTQSLGIPGADPSQQPPPPPDAGGPSTLSPPSCSTDPASGSQPVSPILPPQPPTRPPSPSTVRRSSLLRAVQTHLTLLATRLRKGHLVTRSEIRTLEVVIKQLWAMEGTNAGRLGEQEDVAELFLMLASCLRAPCLPLWQVIHHGGAIEDQDDKRVCTERCLQLAIPDPKARAPVPLEELLERFFFDNKVTLLRKVQRDGASVGGSAAADLDEQRMARKAQVEERWRLGLAPRSASSLSVSLRDRSNEGPDGDTQVEEQMVDAWSTFKLMPFLVGEHSDVLLGDNSPILIPICLKRYYQKEGKSTLKRTSRPVVLPIEIGFDQFTAAEAATSSSSFSTTAEPTTPKYSLVLQSVICHLGESPTSGHFITYVNASALLPGSLTRSLPRRSPRGYGLTTQVPASSALSTAPSSPAVKPTMLPISETASTSTHRPAARASSPPPPPPYSPALPPRPGASVESASSSRPATEKPSSHTLTRSFSADTALYTSAGGGDVATSDVSSDTCDSDAAVADPGPIWLRFDGLGPIGAKVQPYTSTVAITRQLTDEIAKNAYLVFYELRRVVASPAAPGASAGDGDAASAEASEQEQEAGSPVAEAAEADSGSERTAAARGRKDPRSRLATASAAAGAATVASKRPKHVRRHSVAGGGSVDADLALALKMQAKEAAKQKRAEDFYTDLDWRVLL
ncbi:hypothetical protein BCR44DRAFT_1460623 [Catenaria anguillulae PL171]|uniref:ubiquitinyl hydrolase 1 n=1 Tax=Catenaria anguillulae PL171 TaxID=765915 RepID=A0A1Y2HNS1_9FUNG|nr:hypothetical protein BCR44DRAFT_1460623 [Catenaria anguillulae PL171]